MSDYRPQFGPDGWSNDLCDEAVIVELEHRRQKYGGSNDAPPPNNAIDLIFPATWQGKDVPVRQWVWDQWIPVGAVTGLGGPPGAAKSTFAQIISTHYAIGLDCLGSRIERGRALYVSCEDDPDELHRRQARINAALEIQMTDLDNLLLESRLGKDSRLITRFERSFHRTSYFRLLEELIREQGIGLLSLDLVPDFWDGNEISRQEVNSFVKTHLAHFCRAYGTAILLLYHPSIRGIREGDGQSGSTAWEGSMRARLYLDRERGEDGKIISDSRIRTLARPKANYADLDEIDLEWREGYLWQTSQSTGPKTREAEIESAFLWCLDQCAISGTEVSAAANSRVFFGKLFPDLIAKDRRRKAITRRQLEKAYYRLFANGKVKTYTATRNRNEIELIRAA